MTETSDARTEGVHVPMNQGPGGEPRRTARAFLPDPLCGHVTTTVVDAAPESVWCALNQVTLRELPVTAALLALRSAPSLARGRDRASTRRLTEPFLRSMLAGGFTLLHEEPASVLTMGIVGWGSKVIRWELLRAVQHREMALESGS